MSRVLLLKLRKFLYIVGYVNPFEKVASVLIHTDQIGGRAADQG